MTSKLNYTLKKSTLNNLYEPPTNREKRLSRDSRKTAAQNASQRLGAAFD